MDKEKENKPLTIKELKALKVGDWVWVVENEIPQYSGYYKIDLFAISHLHLVQGLGKTVIPFLTYGDQWRAYKNKEEAENADYGNIKEYQDEINRLSTELAHREEDLIHADENVFYREQAVKLDEDKIKQQAVKEFAESKVKPLIDELVELLFDGNEPNCKVDDCEKGSDIPCGASICVEENKQVWKRKIDERIKDLYGKGGADDQTAKKDN